MAIVWNKERYERFVRATLEAREHHAMTFFFDGLEFSLDHAEWVLDELSTIYASQEFVQ